MRKPVVTRTKKVTEITYKFFDNLSEDISVDTLTLSSVYDTKEELKKALAKYTKKNFPEHKILVSVISADVKEIHYEMDEDFFIANATVVTEKIN